MLEIFFEIKLWNLRKSLRKTTLWQLVILWNHSLHNFYESPLALGSSFILWLRHVLLCCIRRTTHQMVTLPSTNLYLCCLSLINYLMAQSPLPPKQSTFLMHFACFVFSLGLTSNSLGQCSFGALVSQWSIFCNLVESHRVTKDYNSPVAGFLTKQCSNHYIWEIQSKYEAQKLIWIVFYLFSFLWGWAMS